jgi:hypothetical protein
MMVRAKITKRLVSRLLFQKFDIVLFMKAPTFRSLLQEVVRKIFLKVKSGITDRKLDLVILLKKET